MLYDAGAFNSDKNKKKGSKKSKKGKVQGGSWSLGD